MTEKQGMAIIAEIEAICKTYGLYFTKVVEYKGAVTILKMQEISIRIDNGRAP